MRMSPSKSARRKSDLYTVESAEREYRSAWVWSEYKAELPQALVTKDMNKHNKKSRSMKKQEAGKRTTVSDSLRKEEVTANRIRAMSSNKRASISDNRRLNQVDIFIFGGLALLGITTAIIYELKLRRSLIYDTAEIANASTINDYEQRKNVSFDTLDPKAIEFLEVARVNISKANDVQNRPELDEALMNLRILSNKEITRAIRLLNNTSTSKELVDIKITINKLNHLVSE